MFRVIIPRRQMNMGRRHLHKDISSSRLLFCSTLRAAGCEFAQLLPISSTWSGSLFWKPKTEGRSGLIAGHYSRPQKVEIWAWDDLRWSSLFPMFWDERTVIFQLSSFYCKGVPSARAMDIETRRLFLAATGQVV